MRTLYCSITITVMTLLLILSACIKQPIQPEEIIDEPDTAKSTFRGLIISPGFNEIITFRHGDILSDGKVPRRNEDGTWGMREGDIIKSTIDCSKHSNGLFIGFNYYSNLSTQAYTNPNNRLDSLRLWNKLDIQLMINSNQNFQPGFSFNSRTSTSSSLSILDWTEYQWYEREVPSTTRGVTTWAITSLFNTTVDVLFTKYPLSFQTPATVESFRITIDKFTTTVPKRISGRISFKMINGGTNKTMVEMREGVFDNVRYEYR